VFIVKVGILFVITTARYKLNFLISDTQNSCFKRLKEVLLFFDLKNQKFL